MEFRRHQWAVVGCKWMRVLGALLKSCCEVEQKDLILFLIEAERQNKFEFFSLFLHPVSLFLLYLSGMPFSQEVEEKLVPGEGEVWVELSRGAFSHLCTPTHIYTDTHYTWTYTLLHCIFFFSLTHTHTILYFGLCDGPPVY